MSKTYLLFPKILKGFECEIWKANRRRVEVDLWKRWKIDGIIPCHHSMWTAVINKNALNEYGVEIRMSKMR